jgi:hypothetical protein
MTVAYSTFRGAENALRDLRKIQAFAPDEFARALYQEAQIELQKSRNARRLIQAHCARASALKDRSEKDDVSGSTSLLAARRSHTRSSCTKILKRFTSKGKRNTSSSR